jgi:hypothetical protein
MSSLRTALRHHYRDSGAALRSPDPRRCGAFECDAARDAARWS